MTRILLLDFDRELLPVESPRTILDAGCLDAFKKAMAPFPDLQIVISSTKRQASTISELRKVIHAAVAFRVVRGSTELLQGALERGNRQREIERYCVLHAAKSGEWLAIDDNLLEVDPSAPLLHVNPKCGFDEACVSQHLEGLGRDRDCVAVSARSGPSL